MRYGQITCVACEYTYYGPENRAIKCPILGCGGGVTFKLSNGMGRGHRCTNCGYATFGAKPDRCQYLGCRGTTFVPTSLQEQFQKSAAPP